jgi:hypothetical protein
MSYIVVEDRTGDWWEGALVDDVRGRQLESRGVVVLPVVADLFKKSGVGGFHKRAWGAGWTIDSLTPRIVCPLTMFCAQSLNRLNWVAKVIPSEELLGTLKREVPELVQGFVKICADSSQSISYRAGVTPDVELMLKDLTPKNLTDDGAFILKGTAKLSLPSDAHYGFGLYTMGSGLRVVWSAISQSHS